MKYKILPLAAVLAVLLSSGAEAGNFSPKLHAYTILLPLRSAGIYSEIIPADPESGRIEYLHIPDLRGYRVTIGLPGSGIGPGARFYLEIDTTEAIVEYTGSGFQIASGDGAIASLGVFGTLECIFDTILNMLAGVFNSILRLDILSLLEYIVAGVFGIIHCLIF